MNKKSIDQFLNPAALLAAKRRRLQKKMIKALRLTKWQKREILDYYKKLAELSEDESQWQIGDDNWRSDMRDCREIGIWLGVDYKRFNAITDKIDSGEMGETKFLAIK